MRLGLPASRGGGGGTSVLREVWRLVADGWRVRRQRLSEETPRRRAVLLLVAAVSLSLTLAAVFGKRGYLERLRFEAERDGLVVQIAKLEEQNALLAREIHALDTDPAAVERIAREELGWTRPGEGLVLFPPAP